MNKKFFINSIILSIIIFGGVFLFCQSAQAGMAQFGDKNIFVDFDGLPFDLSNFAPGMSAQKTITIINNENFDIDVYLKAKKASGDDVLADALTVTIDNKSNHLSDLFNNNIPLVSVNSGESQDYSIVITFDQDAGNKYQNKIINFDFIITTEEIGKGGEEIPPVVIPGGGGGGGLPLGLTIQYENFQVATTTATITWLTSYKSTSRVIYRTATGSGFDLYAGEPNYGYEFCTDEYDTPVSTDGVTGHSITITGLTNGTTYYYRTVSHASPATISVEHSFTTLGVAGDTSADAFAEATAPEEGDDGAGDGEGGDGDTGGGDDSGDAGESGVGASDEEGAGEGDSSADSHSEGASPTGQATEESPGAGAGAGGEEFEYGDHIYEHKGEDDLLSIIDDEFGDEGDDDSKFLASVGAFFGDLGGWRLALMFLLGIILALITLRLIKAWIDRNKQKQ